MGVSSVFLLGSLVCVGLHLLVVQFLASINHRLLNSFASSLQVLALFELKLAGKTLTFDIGDEEAGDQVLNENFGLVLLVLNLVQEVVNVFDLKSGFLAGLLCRGIVHSLGNNSLQVAIN
jgi:hypothetical protein